MKKNKADPKVQKKIPDKQNVVAPVEETVTGKKDFDEKKNIKSDNPPGTDQPLAGQLKPSRKQQNERSQNSKKEGNPAEKNFIAEEGDEAKTQEPQL